MKRVLVGMSGGVDSAVAALLLQKEGYEVCGMTLQTRKADKEEETGCREADDAKKVARELGIFHFTVDCSGDFSQKVVAPFVCSYLDGQTPNPCIMCNPLVKWAEMIRAAKSVRADYVATGHYARIVRLENGRFTLQQAQHTAKDQTYMLYRLTQGQLARTLMPLADYTKDQIRKIALDAGLPVAQKPDSQEICFVTDGHYADFIEEYARTKNAAAPSEKKLLVPGTGYFVDEEGKRLGTHKGITHYTVGQRKGLGIALGHPVYVKKINAAKNEVVLSDEEALFSDTVICRNVNFLSIPGMEAGDRLRVKAKIRYHHAAADAELEMLEDDHVRILFDRPVRAAAPGQSSVFYDDRGCVVGGGFIV